MNRIQTSDENKAVVHNLTKKFQFKDDRTIAQIAIAYSLQLNKRFKLDAQNELDNRGKRYPESLLGEINRKSNDAIYKAVFNQHYNRKLSNESFSKLIKLHLDFGLDVLNKDLIKNQKGKNAHIDYLLGIINNGVSLINKVRHIPAGNKFSKTLNAFSGVLNINLGKEIKSGKEVSIEINNENHFDSQHFALAGMNGSGKTQLVQDVLYQITQQSKEKIKFIFFDYKGEGKSGKLKSFLKATNSKFIDVQKKPLAFNPLTAISLSNERERDMNLMAFRDNLSAVDKRLGVKQKNNLKEVIKLCFDESIKEGQYPSMVKVYEKLKEYYEESNIKDDSLTAILSDITSVVFSDNFDPDFSFTDQSLYINLPATLPEVARKASVFLMLNYLFNYFINIEDVKPDENRIKPIRYVIVIDEAHAFLKEKNMAEVLENLLRMIRSKGVIIMMLSQGIEEYKQRDFDFSSQVKIPILLNVQNKDIKSVKTFVGTPRSDRPLSDALKNLEGGKGIINFNETQLIEINQFWKRKM